MDSHAGRRLPHALAGSMKEYAAGALTNLASNADNKVAMERLGWRL